jgi:hypothetical protein
MARATKSAPAKKIKLPRFRSKARDAAIPIIMHEDNGTVYLDPKPGDETARVDRRLYLVVVNLTGEKRAVRVVFEISLDGSGTQAYDFKVKPLECDHLKIHIDKDFFKDLPDDVKTLPVRYFIWVGNTLIDPDLKIQR